MTIPSFDEVFAARFDYNATDQRPWTWEESWRHIVHDSYQYGERLERFLEAYPDLDEDEVRELLEEDYYEQWAKLDDLMGRGGALQGEDCWRTINLDLDRFDPRRLDPLGMYWSFRRGGAFTEGGRGEPVTYRARIDLARVDYAQTYYIDLHPNMFDDHYEISFHEGSPIYVYDVTLSDGTVIPIEDWRTI